MRTFGLYSACCLCIATIVLFLAFPKLSDWLCKSRYRAICILGFALLAVSFYGLWHLKSSTKFDDMFPEQSETRQSMAWIEEHLGPIASVEVLVKFPKPNALEPYDQLVWVDRLTDRRGHQRRDVFAETAQRRTDTGRFETCGSTNGGRQAIRSTHRSQSGGPGCRLDGLAHHGQGLGAIETRLRTIDRASTSSRRTDSEGTTGLRCHLHRTIAGDARHSIGTVGRSRIKLLNGVSADHPGHDAYRKRGPSRIADHGSEHTS